MDRTSAASDRNRNRATLLALAAAFGLTTLGLTTVAPTGASATSGAPLFTECPAVGLDTGCEVLITVNANGSTTTQVDPSQRPLDGHDDELVGVVNDSPMVVTSIPLSGRDVMAFDRDGLCSYANAPAGCPFGPTGYEGPDTAFSVTNVNSGSVLFTNAPGLEPQADAYFSVERAFTAGTATTVPALVVTPTPISPVEGNALDGATVATFTDPDPTQNASDFSASVSWGDGTPATTGTVSGGNGGPYTVTASHTYAEEGTDMLSVTVTDTTDPSNTATATEQVTVADAPLSGSAATLTATAEQSTGPVTVATFTDGNPNATTGDYPPGNISVDWGDGTSPDTAAAVSGPVDGVFTVADAHTYTSAGTYTFTVTVTDVGGSTLTVSGTATVADVVQPCQADQSCTATETQPGVQSVSVSVKSQTTGAILVSSDTTPIDCGDTFRHAPLTTTLSTVDITSKRALQVKVTFPKSQVQGPKGRPVRVCFESTVPFRDYEHQLVTLGILPNCYNTARRAPCEEWVVSAFGSFYEDILIPPNDPRFH